MIKSRIVFFLIIAVFGLIFVLLLDHYDNDYSYHDILVEAHGIVFDLIVFGILITIYETVKLKKDNIQRYLEEIDDYRFWYSEESQYRIKGLVNRLIKLNVNKIDLSYCNIIACPTIKKMIEWNFSVTKLYNCYFYDINLQSSKFFSSELKNTIFVQSDLRNCSFKSAILNDTLFSNCRLENTIFLHAYVIDNNWFDNLEKEHNSGFNELKKKYSISVDKVEINSVKYYQIIDINEKSKNARNPDELHLKMLEEFSLHISSKIYKL